MRKLVRNKIPEFAKYASYRKLDANEIEMALKNKIVEEAHEVKQAPNDQNLIEELGDVYSVLMEFLRVKNISMDDFLASVNKKNSEKGDFSEHLLMEVKDE